MSQINQKKNICFVIRICWIVLLIIIGSSCRTITEERGAVTTDLLTMLSDGKISESQDKEFILDLFKEELFGHFKSYGLDHRISEVIERWAVFNEQPYIIFSGTVAESDIKFYFFTIVYENDEEGKYQTVYQEIGDKKSGEYPDNLIPYADSQF